MTKTKKEDLDRIVRKISKLQAELKQCLDNGAFSMAHQKKKDILYLKEELNIVKNS